MEVAGAGQIVDRSVKLGSIAEPFRTLSVLCEHLEPGDTMYRISRVWPPRTWTEYNRDDNVTTIQWEIDSEDWKDDDFNDSVITIVAHLDREVAGGL